MRTLLTCQKNEQVSRKIPSFVVVNPIFFWCRMSRRTRDVLAKSYSESPESNFGDCPCSWQLRKGGTNRQTEGEVYPANCKHSAIICNRVILDSALCTAFLNVKQQGKRYDLFLKDCMLANTGSSEAQNVLCQVPLIYHAKSTAHQSPKSLNNQKVSKVPSKGLPLL